MSQRSGEMNFSMYEQKEDLMVEGVIEFQYLDRDIKHTDNG